MIVMARQKDIDRPRSIRIPVTDDELETARLLAGKVPLTTYLRDLIAEEAKRQGIKLGRRKAR